jgi:4-amino-4-deoxy-L-arabinose transferase-like glycosyltransferase
MSLPDSSNNQQPTTYQPEETLLANQKTPPWWQAMGWLILLCVALFVWNSWGYPLFDVDEPRYAQAAREMLQRADWITPYFNWELRFDKPPLHYWAINLAYLVFGVSEFSARLISSIAATGIVLAVYAVGRQFGGNIVDHNDNKTLGNGHAIGWWSAIVTATFVEVIALAHMSITDMTLSLWMTLTTLSCWLVIRQDTRWWLAAGVFSGLAMLTKGPVGIVLPGGILVVTALFTGQLKQALLNRWFPIALIIAFIPFLAWFMAAWQANGDVFIDAIYHHNVSRFTGAVDYHSEPWWYFIPVLLVGGLPWVFFLPQALISAVKGVNRKILGANKMVAGTQLFALVWAVCVFGFFTVADTKLLTYILPMFPGLGLLIGTWLATTQLRKLSGQLFGMFTLVAVIIGLAGVVGLNIAVGFVPAEASFLLDGWTIPLLVVLVVATALLGAIWAKRQRIYASLTSVAVGTAVITMVAMSFLIPAINQLTQGNMIAFVDIVGDAPLASYEITRPSLTYLTNRPIPALKRDETTRIYEFTSRKSITYLITKNKLSDDLLKHLPDSSSGTVIEKGAVYQLVAVRSNQ